MTDDELVRLLQERLAQAGHYTGKIDGAAGPVTIAALDKALPPLVIISDPPAMGDDIPDSGDKKLVGVHNALVAVIREASLRSSVPFTVIEGLRTKARQAQLVKAGASKTSNSRHLTGHAVDLWPLDPATLKPLPSDAAFKAGSTEARHASAALWAGLRAIAVTVKEVAKERGIAMEHGVDWGWDAPHHQLNRTAYPA